MGHNHTYPIRSKKKGVDFQRVGFDLEFMTKEAGVEDYYNVGIVGVRRDHTHYWEKYLRGVSEVINWWSEKVECMLVSFQRGAEGQREEGRQGVGES